MYTPKKQKRFYSPQFSAMASVSVRRLAWALGKPMPKAVDQMVMFLPSVIDTGKVCAACKDNSKCIDCVFCNYGPQRGKAALSAVR